MADVMSVREDFMYRDHDNNDALGRQEKHICQAHQLPSYYC